MSNNTYEQILFSCLKPLLPGFSSSSPTLAILHCISASNKLKDAYSNPVISFANSQ